MPTDQPVPQPDCPSAASISSVVAMAHVADVDRSVRFYSWLGFACASRFSGCDGVTNWADMQARAGRLMLARALGAVQPAEQAILLYMYCDDVAGLRRHLLAKGLTAAGAPPDGEAAAARTPPPAVHAVFDVVPRFYMPEGELRVHDPDGYVLLIGQMG